MNAKDLNVNAITTSGDVSSNGEFERAFAALKKYHHPAPIVIQGSQKLSCATLLTAYGPISVTMTEDHLVHFDAVLVIINAVAYRVRCVFAYSELWDEYDVWDLDLGVSPYDHMIERYDGEGTLKTTNGTPSARAKIYSWMKDVTQQVLEQADSVI